MKIALNLSQTLSGKIISEIESLLNDGPGYVLVSDTGLENLNHNARNKLHHIIPEVVKASEIFGNIREEPQPDILVVTSTKRRYFPAIRYVTYDIVEGFQQQYTDNESLLCG